MEQIRTSQAQNLNDSLLIVACSEGYLDIICELLKMEQMLTEEFLMCQYLLLLVQKVV